MTWSRFLGLAFLVLLVSTVSAQTAPRADWVLLGPEGGDARSLASDPHDPSRVLGP